MKISLIVPVYNALNDLKLCINSLAENFNFHLGDVTLINDCSNEETTKFLRKFAKSQNKIKILENEENLGFVKTCNRGMKLADGDIVILLNSDTKIPSKFCERVIKCFKSDSKIGVASPIGSHTSNYFIPLPKNYTIEKINRLLLTKHKCTYPLITDAEGFCYCIRKDVIEQQGYLDEVFGMGYGEETDFSLRAITNGWKNVLIDNLYVYHKRQASFGELKNVYLEQNNLIFRERWAGFIEFYAQKMHITNPINKIANEILPDLYNPYSCPRKGLEYLFSVKNSNNKELKIITLAGLKIKIRNKRFENNNENILNCNYYITPNVIVNKNKPASINIFIPAINKYALTAGPLGILYFAKYLVEKGHNVVLYAMSRKFDANALKSVKDLNILLERATIINYYGDEFTKSITVSPDDICVATIWNSAYLANHVQSYCNKKDFIYIIQDYETIFYPNSSQAALAEHTYSFNYFPIFSTAVLKDYFYSNNIGGISDRAKGYIIFNTASSSIVPNFETKKISYNKKKKLVFYGRPHRPRNCYELGINAIQQAINMNILSPNEWEFYSVGSKDVNNEYLAKGIMIKALPYANVEDYKKDISSYDLGISLMMSPHPSMVPIDLALSGVPVITNTYKNKDYHYLKSISENIYPCDLTVESIVETIKTLIPKISDYNTRYKNAAYSSYPNSWNNAFTKMDQLDRFLCKEMDKIGV